MILSRSIAIILSLSISGFCNAPKKAVESFPYTLGNATINCERISYVGSDSLQLLQLHNNENTAKKVALKWIKEKGGNLFTINNGGQRLIQFTYSNLSFQFDPNRIFTKRGREETLRKNGLFTKDSEKLIEGFSAHLLKYMNASFIISMHNNTDGAFSIKSYIDSGTLKKDALQVYVNNDHDPDDFFLTTDIKIFQKIKSYNYNIVLQNNNNATDDGSLSVYCGRNGTPYVNVEAQHGHETEQMRMLLLLDKILKEE